MLWQPNFSIGYRERHSIFVLSEVHVRPLA